MLSAQKIRRLSCIARVKVRVILLVLSVHADPNSLSLKLTLKYQLTVREHDALVIAVRERLVIPMNLRKGGNGIRELIPLGRGEFRSKLISRLSPSL